MPRKRSDEGKPISASGHELKSVRLELAPEVHKQLRIEAAKQDTSMASLVRSLVEEYIAKLQDSGKRPKG